MRVFTHKEATSTSCADTTCRVFMNALNILSQWRLWRRRTVVNCWNKTRVFHNVVLLQFLPARRSKRRLCYGNVAGWLGGWVCVTRQFYIKTAKLIWKLFRPSGSPIILVSWYLCADTKFQGEPLQQGVKYTGWEKWRFSSTLQKGAISAEHPQRGVGQKFREKLSFHLVR